MRWPKFVVDHASPACDRQPHVHRAAPDTQPTSTGAYAPTPHSIVLVSWCPVDIPAMAVLAVLGLVIAGHTSLTLEVNL